MSNARIRVWNKASVPRVCWQCEVNLGDLLTSGYTCPSRNIPLLETMILRLSDSRSEVRHIHTTFDGFGYTQPSLEELVGLARFQNIVLETFNDAQYEHQSLFLRTPPTSCPLRLPALQTPARQFCVVFSISTKSAATRFILSNCSRCHAKQEGTQRRRTLFRYSSNSSQTTAAFKSMLCRRTIN